jgi:hypothetical protein
MSCLFSIPSCRRARLLEASLRYNESYDFRDARRLNRGELNRGAVSIDRSEP